MLTPGGDFLKRYSRGGLRKGRIASFLSWLPNKGPVLVIYAHPPASGKSWAVDKSMIGTYIDKGNMLPALGAKAIEVVQLLGLDSTSKEFVHAVIDMVGVQSYELLQMAPMPPGVTLVEVGAAKPS